MASQIPAGNFQSWCVTEVRLMYGLLPNHQLWLTRFGVFDCDLLIVLFAGASFLGYCSLAAV